jgi:hypothetical protein
MAGTKKICRWSSSSLDSAEIDGEVAGAQLAPDRCSLNLDLSYLEHPGALKYGVSSQRSAHHLVQGFEISNS